VVRAYAKYKSLWNSLTYKKKRASRKPSRVGNNNINLKTMPTVIGRHKVGDFKTWLDGHEDRVRIFAPAVSSFKTFRDTDDPNSIALVLEVTDMEKFGAIMNDPDTQRFKDKHTVIEPVTISMQVEV
jgi:hypothetical protein